MHNHHLWGQPLAKPAEVVRWFGAMQAQEFAPAKWAIGQRVGSAQDAAVEKLYAAGEIVRTHVVRPTWHFVHRDDIRWILEATKARVHQLNGTYYRRFGVEGEAFDRCVKLLTKALKGGNELSRKELIEVLRAGGVEAATGMHMGYILMRAELEAVIISGSVGGKAPTFTLFDERVPGKLSLSFDESLAELTRRYFVSRGPATIKDYVRWSSLTVADAKRGLGFVASELEHADLQGRTYFYGKSNHDKAPTSPVVDLIQGYDEYVMSYSESKDVIRSGGPVVSGPFDLNTYLHAVLVDGQLAGHWRLVRKPKEIVVEAVLLRPFAEAETAAMNASVSRLGQYFGVPATWIKAAQSA